VDPHGISLIVFQSFISGCAPFRRLGAQMSARGRVRGKSLCKAAVSAANGHSLRTQKKYL
jgi:hypothetical protein